MRPGFVADPTTSVPPKNGVAVGHPSCYLRPTPLPPMHPPRGPAWPRDSKAVVGARPHRPQAPPPRPPWLPRPGIHRRPFHTRPSREWHVADPSITCLCSCPRGVGGGDSIVAPGCGDGDAGAASTSGLLHRLLIYAAHGSIPLLAAKPDSHSPAPAPD
jgi:hypothetical protein